VELRADFIYWLRRRRADLVTGAERDAAFALLGLDDDNLSRWQAASAQVTSLPHASPNVFFPRVGVAWYARHLQHQDPDLFHLRVVLTHVNFSDLGWRPYAWWYLDGAGDLCRSVQFTRNKKLKHVVVGSQGPLPEVPAGLSGTHAGAARLAREAGDRAVSYMLLMAAEERAAGLTTAGRTVYLPLSLLVEYARTAADGTRPESRWLAALIDAAAGRRITPDGLLTPVVDPRKADVLDNAANIALLALLGEQQVIGGAKMAAYWQEIEQRCRQADAVGGDLPTPPRMLRLPEVSYAECVAPGARLAPQLAAAGIGYSQGMALVEHGRFAERHDPFSR